MLPFRCYGKQHADRSIPRKANEWWQSLPCNNVSVCHSYLIDAFFILLSAFSDSLRYESTIPPIVGGVVLDSEYLLFGINELSFVPNVGINLHGIGY